MKILASKIDRVCACPQSARLEMECKGQIPRSFKDAERGVALHEYVEKCLRGDSVEDFVAENKYPLTKGDLVYADYAIGVVDSLSGGVELRIEHWIKSEILQSNLCIDCWFTTDNRSRLHVVDFKFGFTPVEPEYNPQLMVYALEILKGLGSDAALIKSVELHIIQPLGQHEDGRHRSWCPTASDLNDFNKLLGHVQGAAGDPSQPAVTGIHCKYCDARASCPALSRAIGNALDVAYVPHSTDELNNTQLGEQLKLLQDAEALIGYRATALAAIAENKIKTGEHVPGFCLKQGRGSRVWSQTPEVLGLVFGDKIFTKPTLISPAQAEGVLDKKTVAKYITSLPGAMKLASAENEQLEAIKLFGDR